MGLLGLLPQKSSSRGGNWERSSTRIYRAAFTTDCDENYARQNLDAFIYDYAPHPTDPAQLITDWEVDQDGEVGLSSWLNPLDEDDPGNGTECYYWDATVNYGPVNPLEITPTGNPIDQPINPSFQWTIFEDPVDVAITGKNADGSYIFGPVINSAGVPFDPTIVRDQLRGTIRVSQNVLPPYQVATYFNYGNCINNDSVPWNGFAQFTVKLTPPNMPEKLYSQYLNRVYYRLDYEFVFNPAGWNATPIDRGYTYLDSASGEQVKILDLNGQPVSQPTLLNGSGLVLLNPTPENIVSFNFQVYNDINFAQTFPKFQNLFLG
jgi:hypothetical protein